MPPFNKQLPPTGGQVRQEGMVYVSKGITRKTSDYESARIDIGMWLPVYYTEEDLIKAQEAITTAIDIVDQRLQDEAEPLCEATSLVNHLDNQRSRLMRRP